MNKVGFREDGVGRRPTFVRLVVVVVFVLGAVTPSTGNDTPEFIYILYINRKDVSTIPLILRDAKSVYE